MVRRGWQKRISLRPKPRARRIGKFTGRWTKDESDLHARKNSAAKNRLRYRRREGYYLLFPRRHARPQFLRSFRRSDKVDLPYDRSSVLSAVVLSCFVKLVSLVSRRLGGLSVHLLEKQYRAARGRSLPYLLAMKAHAASTF